jgi:hypothetical protein
MGEGALTYDQWISARYPWSIGVYYSKFIFVQEETAAIAAIAITEVVLVNIVIFKHEIGSPSYLECDFSGTPCQY